MPADKPDRHGWNTYSNFFQIHDTVFDKYRKNYFVLFDTLRFEEVVLVDTLRFAGNVYFAGGLRLTADKLLKTRIVESDATTVTEVRTVKYRYNVSVTRWASKILGIPAGNIFRYDNDHPHWRFPGHTSEHHKHTFEPIGKQESHSPVCIGHDWPTMGEVMQECQDYYHANYELFSRVPNRFEDEPEDDSNDDE